MSWGDIRSPWGRSGGGPRRRHLALDFTTAATSYSGLSTTLTGQLRLARSATTAVATSGASDACFEDRGEACGGGVWSFGSTTNNVPNAFDFRTAAGWSHFGSPTVTNAATTAPDGGSAQKVQDASAAAVANVYANITNAQGVASLWYQDVAGDAPTAPTRLFRQSTVGEALAAATGAWKRYSTIWDGGFQNTAGFSPCNPDSAGATGSIYAWGHQRVTGVHDLPLIVTGAAASVVQQLTAEKAARLVVGGRLCVEVDFIPAAMTSTGVASGWSRQTDGYLWSAESADGTHSLRWVASSKSIVFAVRGSTVLTVPFQGGEPNYVHRVRCWYDVAGNVAGVRITVNGASFPDATTTTTGGALSSPTSFYLGSNVGSNPFPARWRAVRYRPAGNPMPEFILLGDSLVSGINQFTATACHIYTQAEAASRAGILVCAVPGHTIANQKSAWQALPAAVKAGCARVGIRVGINDIISGGASAATVIAGLQDLIATVAADAPQADIVLSKLNPAKVALDAAGAGRYTTWQAVNTATAGGGGTPITGADTVLTGTVDVGGPNTLNDGSDNLAYSAGDGLHHTLAGRRRDAAVWRGGLMP
jgi:hypothetical protein